MRHLTCGIPLQLMTPSVTSPDIPSTCRYVPSACLQDKAVSRCDRDSEGPRGAVNSRRHGPHLLQIGTVVANVARRAVAEQLTLGDGDCFPSLTDKQRDLLNASVAIEQQDAVEAGAIGYTARIWAQLSLPYRNPGERSDWERRNGSLTLTITPAVLRDADGNRTRGYPYGVVPRYLLGWLTSEAVRTRSPEIPVGDSLRHFMSKLGMTSTGGRNGSITRVSEQMRRLFGATMHVEDVRNQGDRWTLAGANFSVADSYRLWFNAGDTPGENPLWGSTVTLSDKFFQDIVNSPVPVDTRALSALGGSAMRIDLYTWLCHRMSYLRKPQVVTWSQLAQQFGSDYSKLKHFVEALMRQLPAVLAVYPTARVSVVDGGIMLQPSPTPVPMRQRRTELI